MLSIYNLDTNSFDSPERRAFLISTVTRRSEDPQTRSWAAQYPNRGRERRRRGRFKRELASPPATTTQTITRSLSIYSFCTIFREPNSIMFLSQTSRFG